MAELARQKVFIANFGRENYLWPDCRDRAVIATFEDEDLRPFWLAGDRAGYIKHCIETKVTDAGVPPIPSVAGRWFNLAGIVSSTADDVWIHRDGKELWWTISRAGVADVSLETAHRPRRPGDKTYVMRKPADPWSNRSRKGTILNWPGLHARAREFLFLEGTLQQLQGENPHYVLALINGDDLRPWHSRTDWKAKEEKAGRSAVTQFTPAQVAAKNLANTARATVAGANGQTVERTVKNKDMRFGPPGELEAYIEELIHSQDWLCAITGLQMQPFGEDADPQRVCSLDRIDSDRHYERENLQVVCRFVNRWKSDAKDAEFRRLIALVQGTAGVDP